MYNLQLETHQWESIECRAGKHNLRHKERANLYASCKEILIILNYSHYKANT